MEVIDRASLRKFGQVRLVGLGDLNEIMSPEQALKVADEAGLDLVLVSDKTTPPVVKVQDFKKIQYEKKKQRKSSVKKTSLKEVQFKANISDHDLNTKLGSIRKFLERGDQVKISVRLKGREREHPERAEEIIKKVIENVDCKANRVPGPMAIAILEPQKSKS